MGEWCGMNGGMKWKKKKKKEIKKVIIKTDLSTVMPILTDVWVGLARRAHDGMWTMLDVIVKGPSSHLIKGNNFAHYKFNPKGVMVLV